MSKEEGKQTMDDKKPTNKFRDEAVKNKVSEQEMMERDQRVTYLRFRCQKEMIEADYRHTQSAIDKVKAFGNVVFRLPDGEARTGILEENKQHIERLEKQLETQKMGRAQEVLLSILEEKFGEDTAGAGQVVRVGPEKADLPLPSDVAQGPGDEPEELKDE